MQLSPLSPGRDMIKKNIKWKIFCIINLQSITRVFCFAYNVSILIIF